MRVFASAELQRNSAEVQKAALMGPVFLTYHDKPRYVMMSIEEFVKLKGGRFVATPAEFPANVIERIQEIAEAYPDERHEIAGGLASLLDDEPETVDGVHP